MKLKKNAKDLVAAAETAVETLSVADAIARHARDDGGTVFVDLRDIRELWRDGKVSGAFHAPRGMLEFTADPDSPVYDNDLNPDDRLILYCGTGGRSALAAKTLSDMGYQDVSSLAGGYAAWLAAQK